MRIKGVFAVLAVFGALFFIGCIGPTGNNGTTGETCGDGTCSSLENCQTCAADCACAASGKEQLFALVREAYNEKVSTGAMRTDKTATITFTPADAVTSREIAREVGLDYNSMSMSCKSNIPSNEPPASLGCSMGAIAPTSDTEVYVVASCFGTLTACSVNFYAM